MKRSDAADLIDDLRVLAANFRARMVRAGGNRRSKRADLALAAQDDMFQVVDLMTRRLAVLQACPGDAHTNPQIDTCSICQPRWGFIGEKERIR